MGLWALLLWWGIEPDPTSAGFESSASPSETRNEPLLAQTRTVATADALLVAENARQGDDDSEEMGTPLHTFKHAEVIELQDEADGDALGEADVEIVEDRPISFVRAWCIPGVAVYAVE